MHVAAQHAAPLVEGRQLPRARAEDRLHLVPIRQGVRADVDDRRAGLDEVGGHQGRTASRRHQHVGAGRHVREVDGPRMADRHRGVAVQQQHRQRLADDVAAADDDRLPALDLDAFAVEQLHHTGRRARGERRRLLHEAAHVARMESVDVLRRIDGLEDPPLGVVPHPGRQRRLHQDAVRLRVGVERLDDGQRLRVRRGLGQALQHGPHPQPFALPDLVAHVDLGSRIAARQQQTQRRGAPRRTPHVLHPRPQRFPDPRGGGGAVQRPRHGPDGVHAVLPVVVVSRIAWGVYRAFVTMRAGSRRRQEREAAAR